ncbi:MAG: OmpA family protein [Saprospiraceae bacterium]|nr:OmpA family protein [Saprospiraceae bacterium]MBK9720751.1 OmpA family protein [Saprospiraceae bacterium]
MINHRQELVMKFGFIQILLALLALLFMQCRNTEKSVNPNQQEAAVNTERGTSDSASQKTFLVDTDYVHIASHHSEDIKSKLRELEKQEFSKGSIADQVRDFLKRGENDFGEEFKFIELRFVNRTAVIDPKFGKEVKDLAVVMNEFLNLKIKLMSYTDNIGDEKLNEKLSQDRAESILKGLLDAGISKERVIIKSYGEKYPVANNKTFDGQLLNNRIEMMILHK